MISGKSRGGVPACCVYIRCISAQLGPDAPTRARLHTATPAAGEPMARAYAFIGSNTLAHVRACLAFPLSAPFRHWEGSAVRQQATPSPGSEAIVRITVLFFPPVYWRSTKICISTFNKKRSWHSPEWICSPKCTFSRQLSSFYDRKCWDNINLILKHFFLCVLEKSQHHEPLYSISHLAFRHEVMSATAENLPAAFW